MQSEASYSLQGFLLGLGVTSFSYVKCFITEFILQKTWLIDETDKTSTYFVGWASYGLSFFLLLNLFILFLCSGLKRQILHRATFLGAIFGASAMLCNTSSLSILPFALYVMVLSFFHFSEYFVTAWSNPTKVTLDSFLLNHSVGYWGAAVLSWVEYGLELYFYPDMKKIWLISVVGLIVCVSGEIIRKLAMITAGSNFNHIVQVEKNNDHMLITSGVYSWFRHPSYVGWFLWSCGTQCLLQNPVCFVIYAVVTWKFFNHRIYYEEIYLLEFFQDKYVQYKEKVCSGIPFVQGYPISS